mgnify:CR=1 FL=1
MEIDDLREAMGTNPKTGVELKTVFFSGVEGISVKMIDYPHNPYKGIFTIATSTWGDSIDKWRSVSSQNRFLVVDAVLSGQALPTAMESPNFTFAVEGCSRSAFDQIARSRVGMGFGSMGWRDNDHSDIGFRIPHSIYQNTSKYQKITEVCLAAKKVYHELVTEGNENWQDARSVLPISAIHRFSMVTNYLALKGFCGNRLKFCEQADTVATAWLMREELEKRFPLLALYLRPSCDWGHVCQYHKAYSLSEAFGCLFKSCGRNPDKSGRDYSTFNYSCSDESLISAQLQIKIPSAVEKLPEHIWEGLRVTDKILFLED